MNAAIEREVNRRVAQGVATAIAEAEVKREMREKLLGGRLVILGYGSAALAPEIDAFMESMLGIHMAIGYSSTDGRFRFATRLPAGAGDHVTVAASLRIPEQACTVTDGVGTIRNLDVRDIAVRCEGDEDDD